MFRDYMDRFIYEFENPLMEVAACNMNVVPSKEFANVGGEFRAPGDPACHLPPCSMTSHGFQQPTLLNPDRCSEGLLDCCNAPSQMFEDLGANPSSHPHHVLHTPFSTTACYDYSVASSTLHVPATRGIPSYAFHPSHHQLQNAVHNIPRCLTQADCTAPQVYGFSNCGTSIPPTTNFYPIIDSAVSDAGFVPKNSNDCTLAMMDVDIEGLIVSSNLNAGDEPQELTITDINMIFDNVERPTTGDVALNRGEDARSTGDVGRLDLVQPDSTYLPVSMQKLCSDDGIEPTLESISASIQELVDPENILSVLEAVPCSTVAMTSAPNNVSVAMTSAPNNVTVAMTPASNNVASVSSTVSEATSNNGMFPMTFDTHQSVSGYFDGSTRCADINDTSSHTPDELIHHLPIEAQPDLLSKTDFEPKGCPDAAVTS